MTELRLVIFDVDGTLVDSQAHIVAAMNAAFAANGLTPPDRAHTLSIVGLSLPVAMARLAPEHSDRIDALVTAYKDSFAALRHANGAALSPLFPGARAALDSLKAEDHTILAIATGKSRRGLLHILDLHDLHGHFLSVQTADDHPSKPHPSMIEACLSETGIAPDRAVIVGDTTFDIDMARAAGIASLGVAWGYHPPEALTASGAAAILQGFDALPTTLQRICPHP
ncbi:HAD-IA family hydrolase [Roseicyclus amphidinii]|uniref:HAD-IA family hydrolase n=1 Tax=Roseicyclus amphidinii TaxID=3034232 RepID=UPI0024E0F235|nr:HAD-IA family hydrolase [Roseicyclus sp. Amp-Y-6]